MSVVLLFCTFVSVSAAFQWNQTFHLMALQYASAAYCPQQRVTQWICAHCVTNFNVTNVFTDSRTNTFAYAGVDWDNQISECNIKQ
jgi:hypothetical protein